MNKSGSQAILVGSLLLGNALLSYGSFSFIFLGWVFFLVFFLPILLLWVTFPMGGSRQKNGMDEVVVAAPFRWLVLFFFLGAIPRAWRINENFLWPTGDEGLHGFLALELARHWTSQFFYTVGEHPPLLIWSLAALFKMGVDTFPALWSLPALFSLLLVPVGYGAARFWFERRWSLVFTFLLALSYWPLSLGRYCHQGLYVPFWELLAFWGMGKLFQSSNSRWTGIKVFGLGLWIGLGTLTFTAWWAVLFGFTVAFAWLFRSGKKQEWTSYCAGLSLGVAPFLFAAVREGYGHHLLDSSFVNGAFDQNHIWITRISYITSIFWGSLQPGTSYGPLWGGMLNPILTTAFWIGLGVLFQRRSEGWAKAILSALFIGLLPGILAGDYVELNRIIQVMPWILMTCVVGIRSILSGIQKGNPRVILRLVLVFSTVLDGWHYLKPVLAQEMEKFKTGQVTLAGSDTNYQAYQVLKGMAKKEGPGIILTDFMPLKYGHTLAVAVHSFNAAENDLIDPKTCKWASLVTEVHYVPFLKTRFPQARWSWFGPSPPSLQGGMVLGLFPLRDQDRKWVSDWLLVHHAFHQLNLEGELSFNGSQYYRKALDDTWGFYPQVRGDRFLESVYWEWVSQFNFGKDPAVEIRILKNAIERGYPAAHLLEGLSDRFAEAHLDSQAAQFHAQALQASQRSPWK